MILQGRMRGMVAALTAVLGFPAVGAAQDMVRYDLSLGTDYRRAQMDWNIAGSMAGTGPNVLSELIWRKLEIAQVTGVVQVSLVDRVVIQGSADYGEVKKGMVRDSDYDGDNRSQEFLRSDSDAGGRVADASLGVGWHFRVYDRSAGHYAHITPMVGYSEHRQSLKINNGVQIIPATGPIANLNSSYNALWKGPWLGVKLRLDASDQTALIIDLQYHRADFSAEADWNLRGDLDHPVSFRHDTQGIGVVAGVALTQALTKHWDFITRIESQDWTGDPGVDTLNAINSGTGKVQPTTTRLNEVHWHSLSAGIAAAFHF